MEVTDADGLLNIDVFTLGTPRGTLKVFDVLPGHTVTLSMNVLDGAEVYAAELKRLETGGVLNDLNNHLQWSEANDAANVWVQRGTVSVPYFTKDNGDDGGIAWIGQTALYTFDLLVGSNTPLDIYDLEFAVGISSGGDPTRYGDEHFYLNVVPEPSTFALLLSLAAIGLPCYWRHRNRGFARQGQRRRNPE
jgi:hypothetical protein